MSAELYIILGALFRLGLVGMFLDPSAGPQQFDRSCALCPPKAMIASSKAYWLTVRSSALRRIPLKFATGVPIPGTLHWHQYHSLPVRSEIFPATPDSPALLTFTSGSTGQPKPVLRTHGFLLEQYRVLVESLGLQPDTTEMTALPLFGLANLARGATTLIPTGNLRSPGAIDPAPILRQIQTFRPQRILASPAFLERLAHNCQTQHRTLPDIQQIISGGAPIMPRLLQQLQSVAPQAEITILYGSTEAEPIAHLGHTQIQPGDWAAMRSGQGLLVGAPIPDIHLKILRQQWGTPIAPYALADFAADCLPPDAVGEIVVSGAHVLSSYWQGRGNSETKFQVGDTTWHRTGDAGYLDRSGRLWLMGRCQACIDDPNGRLYPFAIECVMQENQAVQRSTVISYQGQRLLLIEPVSARHRLDLSHIQQQVEWAAIDRILVLPKIPVDDRHNSKIAYSQLLNRYEKVLNSPPRNNQWSIAPSNPFPQPLQEKGN